MKKIFLSIAISLILCICVYAGEEDVAAVEDLIDSISDEESCSAAREAYDALSTADKLSVSNIQELLDAEEAGFDEEETSAMEDDATFETVEETSESEDITEGKENASSGDAAGIYWYTFEYTGDELTFVIEFTEDIYTFTIYSPSDGTYSFASSGDTYEDLGIDIVWNIPYVTITVGDVEEGQWYIQSDGLCDIVQQHSISAIEETEKPEEEGSGNFTGFISLLLLIIIFIFIYFFFFKKKTALKRKELPKRSPKEEIEMIKKELYKMDFSDHGRQPDLSFMDKKEEKHVDISVEDSYEELDDGTRDLHSDALQEEVKKYMKEQKEQGGR